MYKAESIPVRSWLLKRVPNILWVRVGGKLTPPWPGICCCLNRKLFGHVIIVWQEGVEAHRTDASSFNLDCQVRKGCGPGNRSAGPPAAPYDGTTRVPCSHRTYPFMYPGRERKSAQETPCFGAEETEVCLSVMARQQGNATFVIGRKNVRFFADLVFTITRYGTTTWAHEYENTITWRPPYRRVRASPCGHSGWVPPNLQAIMVGWSLLQIRGRWSGLWSSW